MPANTSSNSANVSRRRNLVMLAYGLAAFAISIVWIFFLVDRADGLRAAISHADSIGIELDHIPFGLWSIETIGLLIESVTISNGANFLLEMWKLVFSFSFLAITYFSYKVFAPEIHERIEKITGAKQKA